MPLAVEQRVQMALGIDQQRVGERALAAQQIGECFVILALIAEDLVQRGLFHIAVDEQNILVFPAHGKREVGCDRALALVFADGGDHDDLGAGALHLIFHAGAQLFDRLHIEKAGGRRGDEQALLFAAQALAQRLGLALMVHDREQAGVQLFLHFFFGLDRIAQIGKTAMAAAMRTAPTMAAVLAVLRLPG